MWLINTTSLDLEEVFFEDGYEFAILSHRWGQEEVSFKDMRSIPAARQKRGFTKIMRFCELASSWGYRWGWIDTCCIDKKSSAELSEAINSMYRWYQKAAICYAYLADVESLVEFARSQWFKRGWTLQELLAPPEVIFFNKNWQVLGKKTTLEHKIHEASGIHVEAIKGRHLQTFNIAERMSWASKRATTRVEDTAYCLLGIFDVNLPLLYGEGEKAFMRLQEAIMKDSDDRTIFAWEGFEGEASGLLARSPVYFEKCKGLSVHSPVHESRYPLHIMTSRGLSVELRLRPICFGLYLAELFLGSDHGAPVSSVCIYVQALLQEGQYARVAYDDRQIVHKEFWELDSVSVSMNGVGQLTPYIFKLICVHQQVSLHRSLFGQYKGKLFNGQFRITTETLAGFPAARLEDVECLSAEWDEDACLLKMLPTQIGTAGIFKLVTTEAYEQQPAADIVPSLMLLGFSSDFFPVCVVATTTDSVHSKKKPGTERTPWPDDLTKLAMHEITCFEKKGWSMRSSTYPHVGTADEVDGRSGLWAFKMDSFTPIYHKLGNSEWVLRIEAKHYPDYYLWKAMGDPEPEYWSWEVSLFPCTNVTPNPVKKRFWPMHMMTGADSYA